MTDLFATPELLPAEVQAVLEEFSEMDESYENCGKLQDALEAHGYTFSWYLDAVPYNLRTFESVYLEYLNDWLTVEKMADHYGCTTERMNYLIDKGREQHLQKFRTQS